MCCRADISNDSRNGNKTLPWPGKKQLQDPYADSDLEMKTLRLVRKSVTWIFMLIYDPRGS